MERILAEGAAKLGPEALTPTGPNHYRPPAGFMDDNRQTDEHVSCMPFRPACLPLAPYVPALNYTPIIIWMPFVS